MATIYRTVGDSGTLARISYTLTDAAGDPVTTGTVTLRIVGQADHAMTHQGAGVWTWDPGAADLNLTAGNYQLEVHASNVALPAEGFDGLVLRARGPAGA